MRSKEKRKDRIYELIMLSNSPKRGCAWLGSFLLLETKEPFTSKEKLMGFDVVEIKLLFEQADSYVNKVLELFGHQMNEPIKRQIPWRKEAEQILVTPNKLLMHTITHEFHHKGQIAAMARKMGYEPPNTDVL